MPGMAAMAMGAAPVVGGALFGAAVGQLRGPNLRDGIKQDLELLEQLPEIEAARREALRRSIDDRIDETDRGGGHGTPAAHRRQVL